MTRSRAAWFQWGLVVLLAVELLAVSQAIGPQSRPAPARIDVSSLRRWDPTTADEITRLWQKARTGGADDWQALAECYAVYGYFPEALLTCRAGRQWISASDSIQPWRSMYWEGLILDRLGHPAKAIISWRGAIEVAPPGERAMLWHLVGRNHLRLEDVEKAEVAFVNAGQLAVSRYERARLLVRTGRSDEAMPLLDELLAESADWYQVHHWKARAAESLGQTVVARTHDDLVQQTQRSMPTDLVVEHLLAEANRFGFWGRLAAARARFERGDLGAAIDRLEILVEGHAHPAAIRLLASALLESRRFEEARGVLESLQDSAALGPLDWLMTGDVLERLGEEHREAAIEAWETSMRLRPTEAARMRLGRVGRRR